MYADALLSLVTLCALGLLLRGPWRNVCTDWAREIAFESRDRIFDLAQAGEMDFATKEYRDIRESLQSLIGHAHDMTLMRLVVHGAAQPQLEASALAISIKSIKNSETRSRIRAIVNRAHAASLISIVAKSPWAICVVGMIVIAVSAKRARDFSETKLFDVIQKNAEHAAC
jgi:hypothetical protein